MATPQQQQQPQQQQPPPQVISNNIDRYVVIHVATTCDEHGVYVTRDSAEVIELGWILLDSKTLDELHRESILVKPVNTPITPLCTSLTTLTWEHVRTAGTFREAITRFDQFVQEQLPTGVEFAFVTLDAWDLRVQLPREARDKAVVLPPYLQHSRTFDLRTEYQHWQAYHPESLPFGASSLTNICAALEVEPVQSSAPIKHNLPFHLQALAPASPRRAMEDAITLARVLRGLVHKSHPHSEHPEVLKHPMDARSDVRAFLSERSKVLHLNGLPHDTTQSELESWFTQYGGRPIAFWTMRTPDQHKPTGTGFAIFSSHEEVGYPPQPVSYTAPFSPEFGQAAIPHVPQLGYRANSALPILYPVPAATAAFINDVFRKVAMAQSGAAESLCMNGRALNEKAIEVAPSSNRVLERAAEVLVSFPPSKNRPRPGDWTCPSCGFSNFQRRTACFRCSYPAISAAPQADPSMAYAYPYAPSGAPMMPNYGGHGGHHGGNRGNSLGGSAPFRPGDWRCGQPDCLYHNFAKNVSCLRCGSSRANALAISEGSHMMAAPPFGGYPDPSHLNAGPGSGPAVLGGPAAFSSPAGGFPGPGAFGPASSYIPSGLGGPLHYGPMSGAFAPNGLQGGSAFDSRAAEAAFSGAGNTGPGATQGGSAGPGFANGGAPGGYDGGQAADPFSFLGGSLGGLSLDDNRRNGAVGPAGKSPA